MERYSNMDVSRKILRYSEHIMVDHREVYQRLARWATKIPETTNIYERVMRSKRPLIDAGGLVMKTIIFKVILRNVIRYNAANKSDLDGVVESDGELGPNWNAQREA